VADIVVQFFCSSDESGKTITTCDITDIKIPVVVYILRYVSVFAFRDWENLKHVIRPRFDLCNIRIRIQIFTATSVRSVAVKHKT
jgi:hypothetical protein